MNRTIIALCTVGALAACEPVPMTTANPTATGAVAGALIGAAVADDDDRLQGALLGGAAGAVAGTLIGRAQNQPDKCVYEDAYGRRFVADC